VNNSVIIVEKPRSITKTSSYSHK